MSTFSKTLEAHFRQLDLSQTKLAKLAGIERTHLHKILSGDRIPADRNAVIRLAEALTLSTPQTDELLHLYAKARIGDDVYDRHCLVRDILKDIGSYSHESPITFNTTRTIEAENIPDFQILSGSIEINAIINTVIEIETTRPNPQISLLVQPTHQYLMDTLVVAARRNPTLSIQHIICLQNGIHPAHNNSYNLTCLKNIFPLLIAGSDYTPLCYYGNIDDHLHFASIHPYLILAGGFAICLSYDLTTGVLYKSTQFLQYYQSIFEGITRNAKPMIRNLHGPFDVLAHYASLDIQSDMRDDYLFFAPEPCLGYFFTNQFLRKHITPELPGIDEIIQLFQMRSEAFWSKSQYGHCLASFFTEEGLDNLLSTGRITEIPEAFYSPLEVKETRSMLRSALSASDKGSYLPVILNGNAFKMPRNLIIAAYNEGTVSMMYMHPAYGPLSFDFSEPSLAFSFYNFLQYLKTSELVLPPERTREILEERINS